MVLKRLVIFFLSFCIIGLSYTQELEVSFTQKLTNKISKFRFLGKMSDKFIVDRYDDNKHIFDIYDQHLNYKSSKEYAIEKNQSFENVWAMPSGAWLTFLETEKDYAVLKSTKIDAKFRIANKSLTLDTIWESREMVKANLRHKLSLNESHIGYFLPIFKNNMVDHFFVNIYNHKMEIVQQKKIKSPKLSNSIFADIEIFNDGSFVCVFQDTDRKVEHAGTIDFHIFYSEKGGVVQEYTYSPEKAIFKKPKFEIDNTNHKLLIAGFYQYAYASRKDISADSFFSVDIDLSTGISNEESSFNFSDEFYFELTGRKNESGVNLLYTFYIQDIIAKADGGKIVLAESYYKDQEQNYNNSLFASSFYNTSYTPINIYHYNDIVIYDIDASGSVLSVQVVNKRQQSRDDKGAYSSFFTLNEQDKLRLLFLSDIDDNATLNEYLFEKESISKPSTVFNAKSKGVFPIARMGVQTAPNEVVMPSFENNRVGLVKLIYNP